MDLMTSTLFDYLEPTSQMIKNLIACEDAYISVIIQILLFLIYSCNLFKKNNDPPREENIFEKVESNNNFFRNSDNEDDDGE